MDDQIRPELPVSTELRFPQALPLVTLTGLLATTLNPVNSESVLVFRSVFDWNVFSSVLFLKDLYLLGADHLILRGA